MMLRWFMVPPPPPLLIEVAGDGDVVAEAADMVVKVGGDDLIVCSRRSCKNTKHSPVCTHLPTPLQTKHSMKRTEERGGLYMNYIGGRLYIGGGM